MAVTNLYHTTTPVGPVTAVAAGFALFDGWVDVSGLHWSINASHELLSAAGAYQLTHLTRPPAENQLDARIKVAFGGQTTGALGLVLRRIDANNFYFCYLNFPSNSISFYRYAAGTTPALAALGASVSISPIWNAAKLYTADFTVENLSSGVATLTLTVTDVTGAPAVLVNAVTRTDSTSVLQAAGQYGLTVGAGAAKITSVALYSPVAASMAAVPTTIPTKHAQNISVLVTGTATNWLATSPTLTINGVAGVTKVSQGFAVANGTGGVDITLVLTTSTTEGTLQITDGTINCTIEVADAEIALSPTSVTANSTGNPITITGTDTFWVADQPIITISAGSITDQTIVDGDTITITLTAGAAGSPTITDPSTGATATLTVAAAVGTGRFEKVFIQDSRSASGAGLTGLAFNTPLLTCRYLIDDAAATVGLTLTSAALGTLMDGAFVEVDATNMPGIYEFDPPAAALGATGVKTTFYFQGAANMVPTVLRVTS